MDNLDQPKVRAENFPHWLRDIDAHLPVTAQFIVHGNIRDRHLIPAGDSTTFASSLTGIWELLKLSGFEALIVYDPIAGLRLLPDTADAKAAATQAATGFSLNNHLGRQISLEALAQLLTVIQSVQPSRRVAFAFDYVSQLSPAAAPVSEEQHTLFLTALTRVHSAGKTYVEGDRAALFNPSIWLVDRPSDLPGWMVGGSDGIHSVPVPLPDLDARRQAAERLAPALSRDGAVAMSQEHIDEFASLTDGMTLRAMQETVQLSIDRGDSSAEIADAVRAYRVGLLENPWSQEFLKEKVSNGLDSIERRVLGQPSAIRRALDILMRSTTGLTSAHTGGKGTGPRGVLFLAGPTGVGKTELAKALTELVFGNETAYIRFDMSEFSHAGSDQRLMGAPPGYIGHEAGGELTNAIRQRPFSLVLFDEIEKADQKIMDKFLQILSDGRLTDGSGATVHFSESLIVFTSNKGMSDQMPNGQLPTSEISHQELDQHVRHAVNRHFTEELGRPEILNRIGDNIVVFDFIRPDVAQQILEGFIANTVAQVQKLHGMMLEITPAARATLSEYCCADMSMGGRGIGQRLETILVNPLARAVFLRRDTDGDHIKIDAFERDGTGSWNLRLN